MSPAKPIDPTNIQSHPGGVTLGVEHEAMTGSREREREREREELRPVVLTSLFIVDFERKEYVFRFLFLVL